MKLIEVVVAAGMSAALIYFVSDQFSNQVREISREQARDFFNAQLFASYKLIQNHCSKNRMSLSFVNTQIRPNISRPQILYEGNIGTVDAPNLIRATGYRGLASLTIRLKQTHNPVFNGLRSVVPVALELEGQIKQKSDQTIALKRDINFLVLTDGNGRMVGCVDENFRHNQLCIDRGGSYVKNDFVEECRI